MLLQMETRSRKIRPGIIRAEAMEKVQANIRAFTILKDWEWMKIIYQLKPIISQADEEKKMKERSHDLAD